MKLREAAQQALELLEEIHPGNMTPLAEGAWNTAITALRTALAEDAMQRMTDVQQEMEQKPVAYIKGYSKGRCIIGAVDPDWLLPVGMALYRSPPTINEMETVEPVAWMWDYRQLDGHVITKVIFAKHYSHSPGDLTYVLDGTNATPLYLAPPKREPLTDEEIHDCFQQKNRDKATERRMIARAIERVHGIGGEE